MINLSLGHPVFEPAATDPLVEAVQKAAAAGIVVVVSAGNCGVNPATGVPGFGGVLSPGNAPAALTVGSINLNATKKRSDDVVNNYSSRGPTWYDGFAKPDIVAPGYHLIAPAAQGRTLAAMYPSLLVNSTYMTLSGTSMAAAVVSGVVAQVIEANRGGIRGDQASLSPNAVKAILEFTALTLNDPVTLTPYSALIQGAGGVNAHGAIALARSIDTRKPKGSTWLAAAVNPYSTIDEVLVWAQNILWGNGILWGDTIYVNRDSWGTGILWGDNVLWGDGILWGDNILWGNGAPWRDNLVFGSSLANANSVSMTDPAFANSIPMLNDDVLNR